MLENENFEDSLYIKILKWKVMHSNDNMFHQARHVLFYKLSHMAIENPSKNFSKGRCKSDWQSWEQTSKAQSQILFKTEAHFIEKLQYIECYQVSPPAFLWSMNENQRVFLPSQLVNSSSPTAHEISLKYERICIFL